LKEAEEPDFKFKERAMTVLKLSSGARASPPVLLEIGDDLDDPPAVEEAVLQPYVVFFSLFLLSINFS
jgi:hypothetical protein